MAIGFYHRRLYRSLYDNPDAGMVIHTYRADSGNYSASNIHTMRNMERLGVDDFSPHHHCLFCNNIITDELGSHP